MKWCVGRVLEPVAATIIPWRTTCIAHTLEARRKRGDPVCDHLLRHLWRVGWEHIKLTRGYNGSLIKRVAQSDFGPLRLA